MAQKNIKPLPEDNQKQTGYNPNAEEQKVWEQYLRRKTELLDSRKNISGIDIDALMKKWDHRYFNRIADIPASELDSDQKPLAINSAFGKVQTALSILIDKNPKIVLDERNPRFSGNRELIRSLAETSFRNTNSLGQFKLSIFNVAKRGWFAGRTYNRKLIMDNARFPLKIDEKGRMVYETKAITKMDDVAYMNLNNHYVWLDEEGMPEDMYSFRDGMWYEAWHIDKIKATFPEAEFPNVKFVQPGGLYTGIGSSSNTSGVASNPTTILELKKGMVGMYFYEHQYDDWFIIEMNGVMVVWEPLPQNHKRLSLTCGYWNLRNAESIYGIGIVEEMERNEDLIDRIVNMDMRQLLLTISPGGFYSGTEDFENENIKIKPGVLRRTLNPKDISWLQIPPGNQTSLQKVEWLEKKSDESTGITEGIEAEAGKTGSDTAFELGIRREAALKRLKLPLKSFQYALDWEFKNRVDLIQQVYSDFQVTHLATEEEIMNYLEEVKADPDFYYIEKEGQLGEEKFFKKEFRELQLEVEQDDQGNFIESEKKKFFKIKPEYLPWEGDVRVNIDSLLVQSEELEKADTLRLANIVMPTLAQDPNVFGKPVKELLKAFNKDSKKWLPQSWLDVLEGKEQLESEETEIPANVRSLIENNKPPDLKAKTIVPENQVANPSLGQRLSGAFKAFRNPK